MPPLAQNNRLYRKLTTKGFKPTHAAEVGVWHPETSNILQYIRDGVRTTLVEPDPESIQLIKDTFDGDNITLHEVAVFDSNGQIELCKREASTFIKSLPSSPTQVNDGFLADKADTFVARAQLFNEIDDGSIDLISIDTEGSEWYVLQNMVSRPAVISIETHGGMYINPYISQIADWLTHNGYRIWYKDKSDSVYVQPSRISIEPGDRIKLFLRNTQLTFRAIRKRLKKRLKPSQNRR